MCDSFWLPFFLNDVLAEAAAAAAAAVVVAVVAAVLVAHECRRGVDHVLRGFPVATVGTQVAGITLTENITPISSLRPISKGAYSGGQCSDRKYNSHFVFEADIKG